jgi:hypothetical protein
MEDTKKRNGWIIWTLLLMKLSLEIQLSQELEMKESCVHGNDVIIILGGNETSIPVIYHP